jgi:2-hydroxychromene-2-carboxylate isomerase
MVTIDVVSDVMCPWCYIGKRRLEAAVAALPEVALDVQWRPFQLDATIPPEGMDRRMYLERKFGGAEAAERVYAPVRAAGEAEAIPFAFDRIRRSPNTINAHRLIRWAGQAGLQEEMVERLFRLYFIEGGDLTDTAVLARPPPRRGWSTRWPNACWRARPIRRKCAPTSRRRRTWGSPACRRSSLAGAMPSSAPSRRTSSPTPSPRPGPKRRPRSRG